MDTAAGLAYRESGPPDGPAALLLRYPESSYMWRGVLEPDPPGAGTVMRSRRSPAAIASSASSPTRSSR